MKTRDIMNCIICIIMQILKDIKTSGKNSIYIHLSIETSVSKVRIQKMKVCQGVFPVNSLIIKT